LRVVSTEILAGRNVPLGRAACNSCLAGQAEAEADQGSSKAGNNLHAVQDGFPFSGTNLKHSNKDHALWVAG
jgi:hypothetical protein